MNKILLLMKVKIVLSVKYFCYISKRASFLSDYFCHIKVYESNRKRLLIYQHKKLRKTFLQQKEFNSVSLVLKQKIFSFQIVFQECCNRKCIDNFISVRNYCWIRFFLSKIFDKLKYTESFQ